jgi:5-methylthioadenosine/S-adenosylhomocysteine deaminase
MAKLLLKNGEVFYPDRQVRRADIGITDSVITFVGERQEGWQADEVLDCTDKFILPGFINTHTHAAMTLFRSYADDMALMDWLNHKIWPAEANLTGEDVYWGSMLAIAEMFKTGTTTFADMYFFMDQVAEAVSQSGARGVLARGMAGVAPTAEQALIESEAFFQQWHNCADGRITVMLGPHAPYTCPPEYLRKVITLAERLGAEIHIHLAETAGEVADCQKQYGKTPIALMDELGLFEFGVLAAHCVHLSPEDMAIMKRKKVRVAHNPGSNMKLASGIAPVNELLSLGICVGVGTDGTASNNNLDMLEELRLTALLHKVSSLDPTVIPAAKAIEMATASGAAVVGLGKVTGQLAPGYKADITIFSMDSTYWYPRHDRCSLLTYSAAASDVHTVLVDGKIVLKNRLLTTIDEEQLKFQVQKSGMRLVGLT